MYKRYKSSIDSVEKGSSYDVSYLKFATVLELANEAMMVGMIHDGLVMKLPYRMGEITIKKYKQKMFKDGVLNKRKMSVNWKETKQLWAEDEDAKLKKTLIFNLNGHSNGYRYMWHWYRGVSNIKNIRLYKFHALRKWNRDLAKLLLNPVNKVDFYEK